MSNIHNDMKCLPAVPAARKRFTTEKGAVVGYKPTIGTTPLVEAQQFVASAI